MSDFDFTVQFGNAKSEASAFTQILSALGKVLVTLESREKTLQDGFSKLEQSFRANASAAKEHATAQKQSTAAQTDAEKEAKRLKDAQDKTHNSLKSWFESMTRGASIFNTWNRFFRFAVDDFRIMERAITSVVKKMEEFGKQKQMAQIGVEIYGGEGSEDLKGQADAMARQFKTTRAKVMEAQTVLLKTGMSSENVTKLMPTTLITAKAEGLSAEAVGEAGSAAEAQFKDQGIGAAEAILKMKAASDSSQTSFAGMIQAFRTAATATAPAGVAFDDVNTMLALAAERGIKFSRAGTAISSAWGQLAKQTPNSKKALEEIGLSANSLAKNISDPVKIIGMLNDKLKNLDKDQRLNVLNRIFGSVGGRAMNAIVMQGADAFLAMQKKIQENLGKNTGGAQFEKQQGNWTVVIENMRSASKRLWETLSDLGNTPLVEFFGGIEKIITRVEDRFLALSDIAESQGGGLSGWMQAISQQGVKGIFKGLAAEAGVEMEQVKAAFATMSAFVKNLAGEVWNTFVDESLVNAVAGKIKDVLKALFSPENIQGGVDMGVEMAAQIFEGIKKSGLWKWILAGIAIKVGVTVSSVALKVLGASLSASLAPVLSRLLTESLMKSLQGAVVTAGAASLGLAIGAAIALAFNAATNRIVGDQEKRDVDKQVSSIEDYFRQNADKPVTKEVEQTRVNMESEYVKLTGKHSRWYTSPEEHQAIQQKVNEVAPLGTMTATQEQSDRESERLKNITELAQREGITYKEAAARLAQQGATPSNVIPFPQQTFRASWGTGSKTRGFTSRESWEAQKGEWRGIKVSGGENDVSSMADTELAQMADKEREVYDAKQKYIDAEKQHAQALEQSKNILVDSEKEINNVGAALKEWLVNPVDTFQQKLLEAKEKFGGLLDALSGKKIDLAEKFGLTTKEGATKERQDMLTKQQERDQRLMELAQTPEEQARIAERMAGRQEKLAEFATSEGDKKAAAQKGMEYYTQAEQATERAQADEEERLRIRKETAEKNLGQDEQAVQNAQTAGERAARLAALLGDYQSLGPKYKEKAIEAEAEWEKAKREADAETSKNIATTAKMSVLTVELLRRIAEKAGVDQQQTSFDALNQENSDYNEQVVNF